VEAIGGFTRFRDRKCAHKAIQAGLELSAEAGEAAGMNPNGKRMSDFYATATIKQFGDPL